MSILIGRHLYGVTLNPLEFVLDDKGIPLEFPDEPAAKEFLKSKGYTENDLDCFQFEETKKELPSIMNTILSPFKDISTDLEKVKTYCFDLAREAMKDNTEHFSRTDLHFDINELITIYHCSIDGRDYQIKITPINK